MGLKAEPKKTEQNPGAQESGPSDMSHSWSAIIVLVISIVLGVFIYTWHDPSLGIKPHEKQILGVAINKATESKQKMSEIKEMAGPDGELLLNSLKSQSRISLTQGVKKEEFDEYLADLVESGSWSEKEKALLRQSKRATIADSVSDLDCNLETGGSCTLSRTHILSKQYVDKDKVERVDVYLGSTKLNFSLKNLEDLAQKDDTGSRWYKWNPLNWNKVEEDEKPKKGQIPLEALGHLFLKFTETEQEGTFYKSMINLINPQLAQQMSKEESNNRIGHHKNSDGVHDDRVTAPQKEQE